MQICISYLKNYQYNVRIGVGNEILKTKIVCTIGPASEKVEQLKQLIENGMDVARLNFSHGDYEEHANRINNIRQAEKEVGKKVAILLDTQGPEIRTATFKDGEAFLNAGEDRKSVV